MHESIKHQIKKYNTQAKKHNEHYNDKFSQLYRDKFIRNLLFKGKNLKGVYILDAMCASGIETSYLLNKGAKVVGLDISKNNVKEFKKKFKAPCYVRSIHKTGFPKKTFDAIYICGGLHHVLPVLDKVIFEIERILKPNGYLFFIVPKRESPWAWGDPSHKRIIMPENLIFLNQEEYEKQIGVTNMSDFRFMYKASFTVAWSDTSTNKPTNSFVLQAGRKK